MAKRIDWPLRHKVIAEWQDAVLLAFDNVVRYDPATGQWESRHPKTLEWESDRSPGRRLRILRQGAWAAQKAESWENEEERRLVRELLSVQGRYKFLRELTAELDAAYWAAQEQKSDEPIDQ